MRTTRLISGATLLAAAALTLTACSSPAADDSDSPFAQVSASATQAAVTLDRPFAKPHLVLTDSHGKAYDLVKETAGKPTLLYFGYTHCPDVCPLTMSDIADAKRKLPAAQRQRLQVIFVTTDPVRDTPERLAAWLGAQDRDFVGLTGYFDAIQAAARGLGVMVDKPVKEKDGSFSVEHGAEVFAFSPKDDKAHFLYTAGVSVGQYRKDLPKLIRGGDPVRRLVAAVAVPAAGVAALTGCSSTPASGGTPRLTVSDAYVPQPPLADMAAGYFTVRNTGTAADRLTSVTTGLASQATLMVTGSDGAMRDVKELDIPAGGTLELRAGGDHLMLMGLTGRPAVGRRVSFVLHFATSSPITVRVPVEPATYRPKD